MTYYNIPRSGLPTWYTTYVNIATANAATLSLTPPQITALTAQLTALNAAFTARNTAVDAAKAATVAKDIEINKTLALIAGYSNSWQANAAIPDTLIAALGLTVHDDNPSPLPVYVPIELVVVPTTTGTNELRWKRNGGEYGVKFDIQVSYDTPGDWRAVTTVTAAKYKHTGQTPGQTAYYRVRARNGNNVSDWSVTASTFANGGGETLTLAA